MAIIDGISTIERRHRTCGAHQSKFAPETINAELQAERAIAVVREEPVVARLERKAGGDLDGFVAGAADLKEDVALILELDFLVIELAREQHAPVDGEELAFPDDADAILLRRCSCKVSLSVT